MGAAAALNTKTDNVGFVGGLNIPLIQDFEAGFVAGVEEVDPAIKIQSEYLSQDDAAAGFENPTGGETAATGMYDNGADVVFHAAGQVRPRRLRRGGRGRRRHVGDRRRLRPVPHRELRPAAAHPDVDAQAGRRRRRGVRHRRRDAAEGGKAPSGYVTYDLASDGVGYATSGDFCSHDIIDQLEDLQAADHRRRDRGADRVLTHAVRCTQRPPEPGGGTVPPGSCLAGSLTRSALTEDR